MFRIGVPLSGRRRREHSVHHRLLRVFVNELSSDFSTSSGHGSTISGVGESVCVGEHAFGVPIRALRSSVLQRTHWSGFLVTFLPSGEWGLWEVEPGISNKSDFLDNANRVVIGTMGGML